MSIGQIRAIVNDMELNNESLSKICNAIHSPEKLNIFNSVIELIRNSSIMTVTIVHKIEYTFGVKTEFYFDTLNISFIDSQLIICIDYKDNEVIALIRQTPSLFEYITSLHFNELSESMYIHEFVDRIYHYLKITAIKNTTRGLS